MRRLKILYIFPTLSLGGGENTTITLAKELRAKGHEITYASEKGILLKRLQEEGIPHLHLPFNKLLPSLQQISLYSFKALINVIRAKNIDLIHAYHPFAFIVTYFASLWCDIPIVISHLHKAQGYFLPWFKGTVICVAEEFRDAVEPKYPLNRNDIIVLRNRIDLERFRPGIAHESVMEQYELKPNDMKIVMISRIDRGKHRAILCAMDALKYVLQKFPDGKLLLVGQGNYFGKVAEEAKERNSEFGKEIIKMAGGVLDTPSVLRIADVVLGIGRCAWEGMACGKPTIVVGEKGYAGIVEPESVRDLSYYNFSGRNVTSFVDPKELGHAIIRILSDGEYARQLGVFSRKYVVDHYDGRMGAAQLEDIYMNALREYEMSPSSKIRAIASVLVALSYHIPVAILQVIKHGLFPKYKLQAKC